MTLQELRTEMRQERAADWRIPIYGGEIYIRTKNRKLIPLDPNPVQQRLIELIWKIEQEGRPVRLDIPKARQHGISTVIESIICSKAEYQENISAIIVADKREHARTIFNMTKLMHEKLNPAHRAETKKSNANEIVFSENHSNIEVTTDARSGTFHIFHSSETAYYRNAEDTMLGALQTVPDEPGTMVIRESTGNGIGNYFYQRCMESKNGESEYELFFIPWHENPDYARAIPKNQKFVAQASGLCGNEIKEREKYNLTDEQLNWRRYQIINKCGRNIQKFMQQYPANLDECFQASGSPVFDQTLLTEIQTQATLPKARGYIENKQIIITEGALNGTLILWHEPEKGWRNRYIIAADTGGTSDTADYSVAYVLDRLEHKICAMIYGHPDAFEFAQMLCTLGKWYDKAKVVIEINQWDSETDEMGNTVIDRMINELKYPNLYRRKEVEEPGQPITRKVGFHTNRKTKQMIVDRLRRFTYEQRDFNIEYNDYFLIEEMKTYIIDTTDSGKTTWNAQEGCHDDRVMAFGIALVVSKDMPTPKKVTPYHDTYKQQGVMESIAS